MIMMSGRRAGTVHGSVADRGDPLALGYPGKYLWTYTGLDFGQAQGVLPVQWLADYNLTEPASAHTLWQFSQSYSVPGVGTADMSVYHGSISALAALAYPGTVTAPQAGSATPAPGGLRNSVKVTGYAAVFTWDPVRGISTYHYQLERNLAGKGWALVCDEFVPVASNTLAVAPRTQYRWRVAAGESNYIWPAWQEFTTP